MFGGKVNIYLAVLIFLSFSIISCKTKKIIPPANQEAITQDSLLQNILNPIQSDFVDAKAKARISNIYGSDKGQFYLRIKNDSVIWIAVKRLSIEGGRALINKDSAFFINRLDKTYSVLSMDDLQYDYGILPKLTYIESLLSGQVPHLDTTSYFEITDNGDHYSVINDLNQTLHNFKFDKMTGYLTEGNFETRNGITGNWQYGDYRICNNGQTLPFKRNYHVNLGNEETIDLELDFSRIELDSPKSITFEIPEHYIKI